MWRTAGALAGALWLLLSTGLAFGRPLDIRPEIAPECYEKVLQTEGLDQEQRRGIRYEQALTLRSAGQNEDALQIFQEILEEASDYRDTEQQIQELMQASGS
mgnify:CR=1 FL=1